MISQLPCEFSDVPTVELSRLFHIPAARSFVQLHNVICQGHLNFVDFLVLLSPASSTVTQYPPNILCYSQSHLHEEMLNRKQKEEKNRSTFSLRLCLNYAEVNKEMKLPGLAIL